jgi:hypothetical protein
MPPINQLSAINSLSAGDNILVYAPGEGDTRRASLSTLLAFFKSYFADPDYTTQISAPTSSGFNLQFGAQTQSLFLIINPTGAFAAGTITLPPVASCFDGQEILVVSSQSIAALTVNGNGGTLLGVPGALGAGGFFTIRFNSLQATWYTLSSNTGSNFNSLTLSTGINDVNGNELLRVSATALAVNELTIANAATGGDPSLTATGGDTNINLNLVAKGTGVVQAGGVPVATTTGAQTLTNKTLTAPIIGTISNTGTLTLPTSTDTLIGRATTDTLTNKTLTSPVISAISNTGTLTLPTTTDTLVGRATTDTLTNKTLTAPSTTGLRRAAPVTKTADFTLGDAEDYIINNKAGSACVVTLPAPVTHVGRVVVMKTIQAQAINSASSNVVPLAGGAAGTAIVSGTAGNWAEIVSDGSNWIIMKA